MGIPVKLGSVLSIHTVTTEASGTAEITLGKIYCSSSEIRKRHALFYRLYLWSYWFRIWRAKNNEVIAFLLYNIYIYIYIFFDKNRLYNIDIIYLLTFIFSVCFFSLLYNIDIMCAHIYFWHKLSTGRPLCNMTSISWAVVGPLCNLNNRLLLSSFSWFGRFEILLISHCPEHLRNVRYLWCTT